MGLAELCACVCVCVQPTLHRQRIALDFYSVKHAASSWREIREREEERNREREGER